MKRADRLFRIIQLLRSSTKPLTARAIAVALQSSPRSIYRDIADLIEQQIPVRGEAGVGYVLDDGYDMPPLLLTPAEVEAAILGARWVEAQGDPDIVQGARDLIAKIAAVIPASLEAIILDEAVLFPVTTPRRDDGIDLSQVREWIRAQRRIRLCYQDGNNSYSQRIVWPIAIAYFESVRLLVTWCELRSDFRHFRVDRILAAEFMDDTFPTSVEQLRQAWRTQEAERHTPG